MSELKGYKYKRISLKKIDNDKYPIAADLKGIPEKEELKEKLKAVLSNNGLVYYIIRDKEVHGIISAEYTQVDAAEYGLENVVGDDSKTGDTSNPTVNAFVSKDIYLSDDLKNNENTVMQEAVKEIEQYVGAIVSDESGTHTVRARVIKCGDVLLKYKGKKGKPSILIPMAIGYVIGLLIDIIFPGLIYETRLVTPLMGMMMGMFIGMAINSNSYTIE
ncbi:MAG: hypothetical protein K6G27_05925 [Lachnospiraceae bacterium]|nr:hypothetical protein [Lachnospiraceae bacterium]